MGTTKNAPIKPLETPWLTRAQAASYIGVTPWTLDQWRKAGKIAPSGAPRYHRDDLDAVIRSRWTTTREEVQPALAG